MRLNLGCGTEQRKGFTNVDNYVEGKKGYKFVKADIRKLPFDDNSASYVEMMSVIEHLSFKDVIPTLEEVRRVMKPGAELVIRTENFDGIALMWIEMCMNGYNPKNYVNVMEIVYGNQRNDGEYHKTAFNPPFLATLLKESGFRVKNIEVFPRNTPIPQFGTIPPIPDMVLRSDQLLATAVK